MAKDPFKIGGAPDFGQGAPKRLFSDAPSQRCGIIGPNSRTKINRNGKASPASNAPPVVQWLVNAANKIIHSSYCYAGGHGSWKSSCYDCSGSVSYALHGAHLLSVAEDSTQLENYGAPGKGRWITIYADSSHTFLVINGDMLILSTDGGQTWHRQGRLPAA